MTQPDIRRLDVRRNWSSGILKMLAALALIAQASMMIRGRTQLADYPLSDDPFYSFSVARNIALGNGITIDGAVLTNGFQPLFTFVTVPFFGLAGEDRYAPLRYVWVLEFLLYAGTAYLLARIGCDLAPRDDRLRREIVFVTVLLLYLCSPDLLLMHYNGLETGCLLFLLALTWRAHQVGSERGSGNLWIVGALLGLVVLTRIDTVFLVIVLCIHQLLQRGAGGPLQRLRGAVILSGVPLLISAPWWLYNYVYFGSLMPSSGRAQQAWGYSWQRIYWSLSALGENGFPAAYLGRLGNPLTDLLQIALGIVVVWLAARAFQRFGNDGSQRSQRGLAFGSCLLIFSGILATWYTISSWATHFYPRYFSPLLLLAALAFGWMCLQVYESKRWIVLLLCMGLVAELVVMSYALHTKWIIAGNVWHDQQVPLVERSVPARELVAAGQSGALGYFRDRVVNVDGKVNPEALRFQNEMWEYLDAKAIRWFCDWPEYVSRYLGEDPQSHGWKLAERSGRFMLFHREFTSFHSRGLDSDSFRPPDTGGRRFELVRDQARLAAAAARRETP